jgi:putative phosphoesterase
MSKIAIISDIHDNIWNLEKALDQINASGAETLLCCGDFCAPFIITQIAEAFKGPIHAIFGNNDADGRLLQVMASQHEHFTLHGIYCELQIGGRDVAMIHYPEPARRIAQSGAFDLVCYGHNHLQNWEAVGGGFLVNPGEVMGRFGAASWGLYDGDLHQYKLKAING